MLGDLFARLNPRRDDLPWVNWSELTESLEAIDATPARELGLLGTRSELGWAFSAERQRRAKLVMEAQPEFAWLLSRDGSGYVREDAVRRLGVPRSAGRLVLLILRLNDWVPQVRAAALEKATALLPQTQPEVAAAAAPYLLKQRPLWGRWTHEAEPLDQLMGRADVAAAFAAQLMCGMEGALGGALRAALQYPAYDRHLPALAAKARLPGVRAAAFKALLTGRASWLVGYEWGWVDKTYGVRRLAPRFEDRPVEVKAPADLLGLTLADRCVAVRKVGADVIVARRETLADLPQLASRLAADRSASIRERGEFLLRNLPKPQVS